MMRMSVGTVDIARAKRAIVGCAEISPQVMARAINRTLTGLRTEAVDAIAERLNVTKRRIREDFSIKLAHWSNLNGILFARGRRINFASFIGVRQTQKGVTVEILKGTQRTLFKQAFIWERTTRSGDSAETVMQRKWHAFQRPKRNISYGALPKRFKLPIQALSGPSPESQMARPEIMQRLLQAAGDRLVKELDHELNYELSKLQAAA